MREKIAVWQLLTFLSRYNIHDQVEICPGTEDMTIQLKLPLATAGNVVAVPQAFDDQKFLKSMGIQA
jgi:hypothetical protein